MGDAVERERLLTAAQVREHPEHADVMFFETALRLLREAAVAGTPVRVSFVETHGAIIEAVRADR